MRKHIEILKDSTHILRLIIICIIIVIVVTIGLFIKARREKKLQSNGICIEGYIYHIREYGKDSNMFEYEFFIQNNRFINIFDKSAFLQLYGDTSLYIGKKVKVKYVPDNPSNNTLVAWDEPCPCDSVVIDR